MPGLSALKFIPADPHGATPLGGGVGATGADVSATSAAGGSGNLDVGSRENASIRASRPMIRFRASTLTPPSLRISS